MTAWNERVPADVTASAPEPPELPRRNRVLGYAVWIVPRLGAEHLSDGVIRQRYEDAKLEADLWRLNSSVRDAFPVELRRVPQ